ncbi:putative trehalose synthase [Pontibacter sp. BAB1700]|nr:putative trehalose synthase [Pontibacter sp. BAB1700]
MQILKTNKPKVLCMHYSWQGSSLIILHNFDEKAHEVILDLKQKQNGQKEKEQKLIDLMVNYESEADEKGKHYITLDAYGYRWFRTGDLSHLLKKS